MRRLIGSALCALLLSVPPLESKTLRRGTGGDPNSLDPHLAIGGAAFAILYEMNVGLVALDAAAQVIPGAAESWDISEDGLTYRFTLRPELKWSDGSPLTSEDFVWSARRLVNPQTAARFASFFYPVKNARAILSGEMPPEALGVSAPDADTVIYELEQPAPYFLQILAGNVAAPVPRAMIEEFGNRWTRPGRMLTNGPYRLVEWVPQEYVAMEKNPHFYEADSVVIDRVEYYPTQNLATSFKRYRAGELDLVLNFPPDQIDWIRENIPDQLLIWPALGLTYFLLNINEPPFDDPRVRRALSMSIDREGLVEKVLNNNGLIPAYTVTPGVVSNYAPPQPDYQNLPMAERISQARTLIQAAGYGPGNPLEFELVYDTLEENRLVVVALAAMWRQLGVVAKPLNVDFITLNRRARTGDFQMMRFAWFAPYDDPNTFLGIFETDNTNNYVGYSDPEVDAAIRLANLNRDPAERLGMLSEIEGKAMAENPVIPLFHYVRRFLVSPRVQGFEPNPRGVVSARYLDLAE